MIPNGLPTLAAGSHGAGSGKACIMNAISYLNGDKKITDMPNCVDPYLAVCAQWLNDSICSHDETGRPIDITELMGTGPIDLCPPCAHAVWMAGAALIGTAEAWKGVSRLDQIRAYLRMVRAAILRHTDAKSPEIMLIDVALKTPIAAGTGRFWDSWTEHVQVALTAAADPWHRPMAAVDAQRQSDTLAGLFNFGQSVAGTVSTLNGRLAFRAKGHDWNLAKEAPSEPAAAEIAMWVRTIAHLCRGLVQRNVGWFDMTDLLPDAPNALVLRGFRRMFDLWKNETGWATAPAEFTAADYALVRDRAKVPALLVVA